MVKVDLKCETFWVTLVDERRNLVIICCEYRSSSFLIFVSAVEIFLKDFWLINLWTSILANGEEMEFRAKANTLILFENTLQVLKGGAIKFDQQAFAKHEKFYKKFQCKSAFHHLPSACGANAS